MILSNKKTEFQIQCQCVNLLEKYKLEKKINFFTAIPNSTYTKSWSQKRKNTPKVTLPGYERYIFMLFFSRYLCS